MQKHLVIYAFSLFLPYQLTAQSSPGSSSARSIDLSGEWNLKLVGCLTGEAVCAARLASVRRETNIVLPSNLHTAYPWFYGEAILSRSFEYAFQAGQTPPDLLLLGSIGSVDETHLNGVLVGSTGQDNAGSTVSAWNQVRAYPIPKGALRPGRNSIEIRLRTLDHKAGLHAGPLEVTSARGAQYELLALRILREYIYIGIPLLLIVVVSAFLAVATYWQKGQGNGFLVAAFLSYLIHSVYFLPVPLSIDYLSFNKIQWTARIWSVMFSALYFARNFGYFRWRYEIIWILLGGVLTAFTVSVADLYTFAQNMFWNQIAFLTHLFYPVLFYKKTLASPQRMIYKRYLPQSLVVLSFYLHDSLVIGYVINTPWLFHYMSIINVIHFIDHFSFHLYMWRDRGRRDAELVHVREKLSMAHELHDAVGAELSQMVVMSRQLESSRQSPQLSQLASGALEKVRNFAHILKGETSAEPLPLLLEKLCLRLRALRRYEVEYLANAADVHLQREPAVISSIPENTDISAVNEIAPLTRMHIERMLSEWTSNVIRHARGTKRLVVGWQMRKARLRIFFYQDAAPFEWRGKAERGGLKSLETRAREIGASLTCRKRHTGAIWLLTIPTRHRPNEGLQNEFF